MLNQIEYSEEIKNLIEKLYSPVLTIAHETERTEKKTLKEIHSDVINVLPGKWIEESDIYDALTELGFKYFQFFIEPKKLKKTENDEDFEEDFEEDPDVKIKLVYFLEPK